MTDLSLITQFLATQYGDTKGTAWIGVGGDTFSQHAFAWPDEAATMISSIEKEDACGHNVWFCVHLLYGTSGRNKGLSVERRRLHADLDRELTDEDSEKIARLGGWTVASGRPGHVHVYVELDRSVDLGTYNGLQNRLVAYLDADTSKVRDNDLMRIPGTTNWMGPKKPHPPAPVAWDGDRAEKQWEPAELDEVLPGARVDAVAEVEGSREPFEPAECIMPRSVLAVVMQPTPLNDEGMPDRSGHTASIVNACRWAGLSIEQTLWVVLTNQDQLERYREKRNPGFMYAEIDKLYQTAPEPPKLEEIEQDWQDIMGPGKVVSATKELIEAPSPSIPTESNPVSDFLFGESDFVPDPHSCEWDEEDQIPSAAEQMAGVTPHQLLVEAEVEKLRVRDEARQAFVAEQMGNIRQDFEIDLLSGVKARPPEPPHRVHGLIPWNANTLILAQRKTGKTTLTLSIAKAFIEGGKLLGHEHGIQTIPIAGDALVLYLNFEMTDRQLAEWADRVGVPEDRLIVASLRGMTNPFATPELTEAFARKIKERYGSRIETVIVDTFSRAFTGDDQNANGVVSAFLGRLDEFAHTQLGAKDLILTAHMGWGGDRARGASALEDWPDSIIKMVRNVDDKGVGTDDDRFLSAMGREVELMEDRLEYDPVSMALSLSGEGSRAKSKAGDRAEDLIPELRKIIGDRPGLNQRQLKDLMDAPERLTRKAIERGSALGQWRVEEGGKRALLYYPKEP